MQVLTEKILEQQLGERVLSDTQLARLLGGSDARRYGSVNRDRYAFTTVVSLLFTSFIIGLVLWLTIPQLVEFT